MPDDFNADDEGLADAETAIDEELEGDVSEPPDILDDGSGDDLIPDDAPEGELAEEENDPLEVIDDELVEDDPCEDLGDEGGDPLGLDEDEL